MAESHTLQNLMDRLAVADLLARYADAVNHRDWATVADCWAEDGVWDLHAPVNGCYEGRDALMKEVRRATESQELFVQTNHNSVVRVDGDSATARTTLNEIGRADPTGEGALPGVEGMNLLAFYTDRIAREPDGQWRFKRRTYDVVNADFAKPDGQGFPLPQ